MVSTLSDNHRLSEVVSPDEGRALQIMQLLTRVRGAKSPAKCRAPIFMKMKVGSQGESCS